MEHKHLILKYLQTTGKRDIVAIRVDGEVLSNTVWMYLLNTSMYPNTRIFAKYKNA